MDQQERGNSIVGNGPKQESAGVKRREYKPPALRLVFTAGKSRPGSVDRELPPREIRKRQLYGWPQPSKKPDVFDARH
ncbi:hypothetical protein FRC03_003707 [Tulasnella sp. 419]|nr:hypothetical protein FRC03_003707 [Tulasnella sp. 419]